jgi:vacuolar-type H+-ATPase subunit D/Vma8
MRSVKSNEPVEIDQTLENDIGRNIRTLTRNSVALGSSETTGDNLAGLLRRVSDASTREIESLIGELHGLRNKLESHSERIQSDIAKYAELSQGVMQLTIIISDNVKKLPADVADGAR